MFNNVYLVALMFIVKTSVAENGNLELENRFPGAHLAETDTRRGFPDPKGFQKDHGKVPGGRPLLMKNAAISEATFAKMPDLVMSALPHAFTTFVTSKKRSGDEKNEISLRTFLQLYTDEDSYIDEQIPDVLKMQTSLPKPIQCSDITDELLSRTRLQLHRGNWKDSYKQLRNHSQIACLLDGKANIVLINPEKLSKRSDESGVTDFTVNYDSMKDISEFQEIKLMSGDCIFVPSKWIYQTTTEGRTMMTSIYWKAVNNKEQRNHCKDEIDQKITLDQLRFEDETSESVFDLLTLNTLANFIEKYVMEVNVTETNFLNKIQKDERMKGIQVWDSECEITAKELFAEQDIDGDRILSVHDFEALNKEVSLFRAGTLEDRFADFREIIEDQEEDFKKPEKSVLGLVGNMKVDYEKEIQKVLEEGFNEILREVKIDGSVKFSKDGTPEILLDKEIETEKHKLNAEDLQANENIEDILAEEEKEPNLLQGKEEL